jgi:UDP-GlcNAc:undecaprenyl-phosphate GlcNAc-1-phosphate transferase
LSSNTSVKEYTRLTECPSITGKISFGITRLAGFELLPIAGYGLTVFWILLFINAVNLLDGLDGLSAGVCLFCTVTMTLLTLSGGDWIAACLFACLSGALIGFLRYNFNPASIFMGDGGSYFLGYTIAVVSLCSSVKTQTGATMLIPILAMGVPMFDSFLSPIRRFLIGKEPFKPDTGHIHHKLFQVVDFNVRKAVLIVYLITLVLCLVSLVVISVKNEFALLVLVMLGACACLLIEKLGYLNAVEGERIVSWIRDIGYITGVSRKRRDFLRLQLNVCNSRNDDEFWENVSAIVAWLDFDHAEMEKKSGGGAVIHTWCKEHFDAHGAFFRQHVMKLELPMVDENGYDYGTLWLVKDIRKKSISRLSLLRVEQLRRTIERGLKTLKDSKGIHVPASQAGSPARVEPLKA